MKTEARMFTLPKRRDDSVHVSSDEDNDMDEYLPNHLDFKKRYISPKAKKGLIDHTDMMEKNRTVLNKFESLSLNGNTLAGLSIGGYDIDLTKAAEKTMEILPMPASKLPIIFTDETLNFYHHFFQGMVSILGQSTVNYIVNSAYHYRDDKEVLGPLIEDMILNGFNRGDSESTLLIKKILTSTFEIPEHKKREARGNHLRVAANLWGFQYIECGMQLEEVDLKMWFSICHSHYKTTWFNAFKTTGVPSFATNGIRKSRSSESSGSTMPSLVEEEKDDNFDKSTVVSRSRRHRRSSGSSQRSMQRMLDDGKANQVTRWLSGRN